MMLPDVRQRALSLPAAAREAACRSLGTDPRRGLAGIESAGYDAADLVLALLRAGLDRAAEHCAGLRITRLPAQPTPQRNLPLPRRELRLRVVELAPNPRLPTTPAWSRFRELRAGMTPEQYKARVGGWRGQRDLREWCADGSVRMEVC